MGWGNFFPEEIKFGYKAKNATLHLSMRRPGNRCNISEGTILPYEVAAVTTWEAAQGMCFCIINHLAYVLLRQWEVPIGVPCN